jgi:putative nucleotidyltransferase with HDIG domain
MATHQKITRSDHVASLALPPGRFARVFGKLHRTDVLIRIGLCLLAVVCMWAITAGWAPPFGYRTGYTPPRDINARIAFTVPDPEGTRRLREQKRSEVTCVYVHDNQPLKELRSALKSRLFLVLAANSFDDLEAGVWKEFGSGNEQLEVADEKVGFANLRAALAADSDLTQLAQAVERAFQQFENTGLIDSLGHPPEEGSQISIEVHPVGKPGFRQSVDVRDVRIAEVTTDLKERLTREFKLVELPAEHVDILAQLTGNWFENQGFPSTLDLDVDATRAKYDELLPTLFAEHSFLPGDQMILGGQPVSAEKLEVLRREHEALIDEMTAAEMIAFSIADLGMYTALFILCGVFAFNHQPLILTDLRRLSTLLAAVVVTVALGRLCTGDLWQAEVIPIVLFGMTIAIVYSRELALLLSAAVSLILCVALGMELAEFVLMIATGSAAILLLNRVRSRTKLIYVGLGAAAVAIVTTLGIGTLIGEPLGTWSGTGLLPLDDWRDPGTSFIAHLVSGAVWHGFCTLLAALIMTGLLPFIERIFDVQTDISLLELGDAAHPLLQELARRAPGTYNHSINVASLAEVAAESIGANGLLVRVGAYFHDIGKLFKPGYFVENQGRDANRHESLLPAMSTLVIIAHVKDGADLARQNRLPGTILDFIEQHHGTTLVEYFYRQAALQSENDPDSEEVEESSYRYPGPKPQTREAAVLMMADAAESASRTLVDPTPARIESLVEDILMKKLLDGQFEECFITLQELSRIQDSLVKALTAVYHARVKYPDQQTA